MWQTIASGLSRSSQSVTFVSGMAREEGLMHEHSEKGDDDHVSRCVIVPTQRSSALRGRGVDAVSSRTVQGNCFPSRAHGYVGGHFPPQSSGMEDGLHDASEHFLRSGRVHHCGADLRRN